MSYIGNNTQTQSFTPNVDYFSGTGSTTAFTLSRNVASVNQIQVFVGNVPQNPIFSYTVSGNTINFITAPASGTNNIYVYYVSSLTQTIAPSQNTVLPSSLSVSNALYWDAMGDVGIGTTSTENKFNVLGNAQITGYGILGNLNLQGGNNLLTYSQLFSNAAWSKTNSSISGTLVTAPDGTTTGSNLVEDTSTGGHNISTTVTTVVSTGYTTSFYAKSAGRTYFAYVGMTVGGSGVASLGFNLSTGTTFSFGQGTVDATGTITSVGNGWYKCTVFSTANSTSSSIQIRLLDNSFAQSYTGNGTSGIYIWGAQLELGSVASAYTPTTTAAITTTNNISVPSGQVLASAGTTALPSYSFGTNTNTGFFVNPSNSAIQISVAGVNIGVWVGTLFGAYNGISLNSALNTNLYSDAANTLAQRNSTNAQTFRLYNTYTDASNYERLSVDWSTTVNTATISTQNAGTGVARGLNLTAPTVSVYNSSNSLLSINSVSGVPSLQFINSAGTQVIRGGVGGSNFLDFGTNNTYKLRLDNNGMLVPLTDATYDLGVTSTGRFRNAYFSGVVTTNSDASINTVKVGLGGGSVSTNIAIGAAALNATATGTNNIGIGYLALSGVTSGVRNVCLGNSAGQTLTTTNYNVFVGHGVGQTATGNNNTGLGGIALYNNQIGDNLTAIGYSALVYNTAASNLTAIGTQALQNNTTNVATLGSITGGSSYTNGTYTGVVMTLSSGSTAITYPTATIVVSGGAVTTVTITSAGVGFKDTTTVLTAPAASIGGTGSGFSVPVATLASGTGNCAGGYQAMYANTVGTNNTSWGYQSLNANIAGNSHSAFGYGALTGLTGGNSCVGIGMQSLYSATATTGVIGIGYRAGWGGGATAQINGSYSIYIGTNSYGGNTAATNEIVIAGSGGVGLGSNTTVIGNSSTTRTKVFGTVETTGYTVATLPTAGIAGRRAYVTDALAPTYLGALVGGGAVTCPAFDNGTAWVSA